MQLDHIIDLVKDVNALYKNIKLGFNIGEYIGELIGPYVVEPINPREVFVNARIFTDGQNLYYVDSNGSAWLMMYGKSTPVSIPNNINLHLKAVILTLRGDEYLRTKDALYKSRFGDYVKVYP